MIVMTTRLGRLWWVRHVVGAVSRKVSLKASLPDDDADETQIPTGDTDVLLKPKPKTKKPSMYRVLLLNDDYTPMDFVIEILEKFFDKSHQEATEVMLSVHNKGVGVCGIYTYEIAETKVTQVMDHARQQQHPLQCTLEKE